MAMLQQKIKSKKIVHKVGDIEVVVTGEGKIKRIEISREENRELAKAINAAITEAQKWAAAEMQGMMGDLQKFLGK